MTATMVRARHLITRTLDRHTHEQIDDAALVQEDGVITAIGAFEDLRRRYPDMAVLGDGGQVVLPGFVNSHHHVGLTPVQLGSPDMPLELWFITRLVCRNVNLRLDTLYSAFEMLASGVTTVQHIHGWIPGGLQDVENAANAVIGAYEEIGMRVSYSFALRDQNRLVYQADQDFVASLPEPLREPMARHFARFHMSLDDNFDLFRHLRSRHLGKERVRVQLAPANLHWCSDAALARLGEMSASENIPMHMHLLETAFQKEYAARRGGCTAVEYIDRFGLVTKNLTLGHGVWLSEKDIDRLAEAGACVCHNCSSNFRLRSGIAPLNRLEARGVTTAIGTDEAGINDDRDMLQEMRMVLRAHRTPGIGDEVPTMQQVLRMATAGGARTTAFEGRIGTLEVGRAADLVMIDWHQVAWPFLDDEMPVLDAVLQRAKTGGVRATMVAGEVLYQEGRFTRLDQDAVLKALHEDLSKALADDEVERRKLSKALLPHVQRFYSGYFDPSRHQPFYRQSSLV
ncbi:amidohydrolase family protein [Roseomonas sp. GC11]|uniref:amidohydrolase family protein n=1 Tax=Roseomonas sp. GC11 TaxID=2950546 RepID=UPI00210EE8CB|nr:amidohydrolase family protein [Roseomonas sp. GC11]MCQ4159049.1 amidohydrolase family protein [Roseomonas sp. GC11]